MGGGEVSRMSRLSHVRLGSRVWLGYGKGPGPVSQRLQREDGGALPQLWEGCGHQAGSPGGRAGSQVVLDTYRAAEACSAQVWKV